MKAKRNAMRWFLVSVLACFVLGCGGPPPPEPAPDRTAPGAQRSTESQTCKWSPPLPDDREDVCDFDNKGALLEITNRIDMRASSNQKETHTCRCN